MKSSVNKQIRLNCVFFLHRVLEQENMFQSALVLQNILIEFLLELISLNQDYSKRLCTTNIDYIATSILFAKTRTPDLYPHTSQQTVSLGKGKHVFVAEISAMTVQSNFLLQRITNFMRDVWLLALSCNKCRLFCTNVFQRSST